MCDVSATETAIIYGLEPVWGAAFAWTMLGERWGMTGFVGAIFIIGTPVTLSVTSCIVNFNISVIVILMSLEKFSE
jgi:drug/metabolite transporter (DMT)-like permease